MPATESTELSQMRARNVPYRPLTIQLAVSPGEQIEVIVGHRERIHAPQMGGTRARPRPGTEPHGRAGLPRFLPKDGYKHAPDRRTDRSASAETFLCHPKPVTAKECLRRERAELKDETTRQRSGPR